MIKSFVKKQRLDAGLPLHVEAQAGVGAPVVFLHGLGGTNRYWTCQLKQEPLAGKALFVDLLGFGESPQPWCQYTIERHLAALDTVLSGGFVQASKKAPDTSAFALLLAINRSF